MSICLLIRRAEGNRIDKHLNRFFVSCFFTRISLFCRKLFYAIIYYVTTLLTIISPRNDKNLHYELELIRLPKILQLMAAQPDSVGSAVSAWNITISRCSMILVGHALMPLKLRISPKIIYSSEIIPPVMRNYFLPDLILCHSNTPCNPIFFQMGFQSTFCVL
jgi:hypothetical protein